MWQKECLSISLSCPLSLYLVLLPPGGTEEERAGHTQVRDSMCARVCVPADEKGGRNEGKGLKSHIFFLTEGKKSICDLKAVYEFLA